MNKATRVRRAVIAVLSIMGVVFVVGAVATELLGLDLTPGFGVLQTLAFLIGLTVLTIAVYLSMSAGNEIGRAHV